MNNSPVVVVDSDAIIAQVNPADTLHKKVFEASKWLIKKDALLIYPATTIAEATAHIQRVLNSTATAYEIVQLLFKSGVRIEEVNKKIVEKTLDYFDPKTSKKNTLFDCIVAVVAKYNNADAIFSFDKFYKKNGFKLVSDLMKSE